MVCECPDEYNVTRLIDHFRAVDASFRYDAEYKTDYGIIRTKCINQTKVLALKVTDLEKKERQSVKFY